jgi:hypothetical protein
MSRKSYRAGSLQPHTAAVALHAADSAPNCPRLTRAYVPCPAPPHCRRRHGHGRPRRRRRWRGRGRARRRRGHGRLLALLAYGVYRLVHARAPEALEAPQLLFERAHARTVLGCDAGRARAGQGQRVWCAGGPWESRRPSGTRRPFHGEPPANGA